MPCMCGATDCLSCGPARGYTVARRFIGGRFVSFSPDDEAEADEDIEPDPPEPDRQAENDAADRYQRDIERNYP